MHLNALHMFHRYGWKYIQSGSSVLEIGPDKIPSSYKETLEIGSEQKVLNWDYLDIKERPGLTYLSEDPYVFPVQSNSYDVVFSACVFEHVPQVWTWMKEKARVCKPGGHVITICPLSWKYHEDPVDCWRAFPDGVKAVYEWAGLEPVESFYGDLCEQAVDTVVVGVKGA